MSSGSARPLLLYTVGLVLLILASYAAAFGAFESMYRWLPEYTRRSNWMGYLLNWVAPCFSGIVCAFVLDRILLTDDQFRPTIRGHLYRAIPWYLFAFCALWIMHSNRTNTDFGLWSQIITWPLAAIVGALVTDILLSLRCRLSSVSGTDS